MPDPMQSEPSDETQRQKSLDDLRRSFERWRGAPVPDRIWQDEVADLEAGNEWSATEQVAGYHRVDEHEWQLAATEGTNVTNADIVDFFYLRKKVRLARGMIFQDYSHNEMASHSATLSNKDIPPPFTSLQDAWDWISQEFADPSAQEHFRYMENLANGGLTTFQPWDNPLLNRARSKLPPYFFGMADHALQFDLSIPPSSEVTRGALLGTPGPVAWTQSTEETVPACSEKLLLLAVWSAYLSAITKYAWRLSECAEYLLTGALPKLERWRIWIDQLPGGGKRSTLELFGSWNYHEMRAIHRIAREHNGTYRKKSFTPADLHIIDFVDSRPPDTTNAEHNGWTWAARLAEWQRLHPEDTRWNSPEAMQMAYKKAKERKTRP